MNKYIAILTDGEVHVHFPHTTGNYATLCGMDGDDSDPVVDQTTVPVPKGRKVDCPDCVAIYDVIHKYNEKDLDRK